MLDYIPMEILMNIMKRLPVKPLLQFRSVSKRWKSIIDSCEFIGGYSVRKTQPRCLLVWYEEPHTVPVPLLYQDPIRHRYDKHVSLVDDVTFIPQEFAPTVPELAELLVNFRVVGSSLGLFLLYGNYTNHPDCIYGREMAVLWNPSIRKSVCVTVTAKPGWLETVLGFGVCPITSDPKIVKFSQFRELKSRNPVPSVIEVFTLTAGRWRILSTNLQNNSITFTWGQVVVDRLIYWFCYDDKVDVDGKVSTKFVIMSFDMTTEEFGMVDIPDSLANLPLLSLSISKVSEALAVLEYNTRMGTESWDVWIMGVGVPNSCTKLLTINNVTGGSWRRVLGFTERGELIVERQHVSTERSSSIFVHEPCSQYSNNIGIVGHEYSFYVGSYMETLLLLDQSDCSVYVENSFGPMHFTLWMNSLPKEVLTTLRDQELHPLPLATRSRHSSIFSLLRKLRLCSRV